MSEENNDLSGVTVLPDGSAFATMSYKLPEGHWSTAEILEGEKMTGECSNMACPPESRVQRYLSAQIELATKVGYRGASMCGKIDDIDPDALTQNVCFALLGPLGTASADHTNPIQRRNSSYPIGNELLVMVQLAILDGVLNPEDLVSAALPENLSTVKQAYDTWLADRRPKNDSAECSLEENPA